MLPAVRPPATVPPAEVNDARVAYTPEIAMPDRSDSDAPFAAPSPWPIVSLPQLPENQTLAWRRLLVFWLPSFCAFTAALPDGLEEVCSSQ